MVFGRFTMMPGCVFVMFSSLAVMLCSLLTPPFSV
jgi:hypothetical protein